jgi:hypothetical protein
MRERIPPMQYDGHFWWYTEWFDETDDRCCVCRQLIPEDDVPLILFKDVGGQTWQTRIHWHPCAETLFASGALAVRKPE